MIGVVLKGYPRLSETFIAQELAGLESLDFPLHLISLRFPTDRHTHPIHSRVTAPVTYLPEYLYQDPARVWRAWRDVRRWATYDRVRRLWWRDLRRDRTPNRGRRFGQALVLAHELQGRVSWLYAHFLHTPASVARYAAALLDIPWSVSAHAKDVWTIPEWEKREKLHSCQWLVTCTRVNAEHLETLGPSDSRVHLVYHGLDFQTFSSPGPRAGEARDDSAAGEPKTRPIEILSVGRMVEKKGYDDLLAALARLPASLDWRFRHIGGGPLAERLKAQVVALDLEQRVEWLGARPQPDILSALRSADVFVLASRIAGGGDRDGLPNVLMEACSQALPCVATRVSAIPELIEHDVTGLLVEPRDVEGLADALTKLISDAGLRQRLGEAGYRCVRSEFSHEVGLAELSALLRPACNEDGDRRGAASPSGARRCGGVNHTT